jgi:hypothetical protein
MDLPPTKDDVAAIREVKNGGDVVDLSYGLEDQTVSIRHLRLSSSQSWAIRSFRTAHERRY